MNVVKELGLSWALYGLYVVAKASSYLPMVNKELKTSDFSMVFKAGSGKVVRNYTLSNGKVSSGKEDLSEPGLSVSWASASSCVNTSMAVLRGDRSAPLKEILDGNLAIEGDVEQLFQLAQSLAPIGGKVTNGPVAGVVSKIRGKMNGEGR